MSNHVNVTYACTVLKVRTVDGAVRTFQAGDVIRLSDPGRRFAFSDAVILGFSDPAKNNGAVYAKLGRPFAYASCIGTTDPNTLTGVEMFEVALTYLLGTITVSNHPRVTGSVAPIERGFDSETITIDIQA